MIDPRVKCSDEQLVAAKELIQAFYWSIEHHPELREFNLGIILRINALLRGEAPVASARDDQIREALDSAELMYLSKGRPV